MMYREQAYLNKGITVRTVELRRKRDEKWASAIYRKVLRLMYKPYLDKVKQAKDVSEIVATAEHINLSDEQVRNAQREVYRNVGKSFGKWTYDNLKGKSKDEKDNLTEWLDGYLIRYVEEKTGERIKVITNTTRERYIRTVKTTVSEALAEGLSVEDIATRISQRLNNDIGYRAVRIARTEVISASNAGSIAGARATNLALKKVWMSTKRGHTRLSHQHMDGKGVDMMDRFSVPIYDGKGNYLGSEMLDYPGDTNGSAGNVINCRCTVVYERSV